MKRAGRALDFLDRWIWVVMLALSVSYVITEQPLLAAIWAFTSALSLCRCLDELAGRR